MAKFQLWSRDEYGQGSIIFTSDDIDEVVARAKAEVTDLNVNNSLTMDDRERNWEAYMVMLAAPKKERSPKKYVYAGGDPRTKNDVIAVDKSGNVSSASLLDEPKFVTRIYLGNVSTTRKEEVDWFARDARRQVIESIDHPDLQAKTQFFIKMVQGMAKKFDKVKDSGERQEFSTGARRDIQTGKGRFDLLPVHALMRLARHFENGAVKYGDDNWRKGIPLRRYLDSLIRHCFKFAGGLQDEDHLAAIIWNACCLLETQEMIERGMLPKELDNLPTPVLDERDFEEAPE